MIKDGRFAPGQIPFGFLYWRPQSDSINELLIALLLTILSYQLATVVIDLMLGWKKHGEAKMHDIHLQMLVLNFAPGAIVRALFPKTFYSMKASHERGKDAVDDFPGMIQFSTIIKLLFLLFIIPLINMATIILSLERNVDFTVRQSNFGGVELGVDFDQKVTKWQPLTEDCRASPLLTSKGEQPKLQFFMCQPALADSDRSMFPSDFSKPFPVTITLTGFTQFVAVTVVFKYGLVSRSRTANVIRQLPLSNHTKPEKGMKDQSLLNVFHIRQNVTRSDAEMLTDFGYQLLNESCPIVAGSRQPDIWLQQGIFDATFIANRSCILKPEFHDQPEKVAKRIANTLIDQISIRETKQLSLFSAGEIFDTKVVDGNDFVLFTRRGPYLTIPILGFTALTALLLRMITSFVTNNDVGQGIELIVRDGLGLPCCDTMLCSHDVVASFDPKTCFLRSVQ